MKKLKSVSLGDELCIIDVESTFTRGLPGFSIVGLPNSAIKESTERIKACLMSKNYAFPAQKITINLSPSGIPKNGSHFDLAMAILILLQKQENLEQIFVFGELGLDGAVKSTNELFSLLLFLSAKVQKARVLVPKALAEKAAMIPNLEVFAVQDLDEAVEFFSQNECEKFRANATHPLFAKPLMIENELFIPNTSFPYDFSDIKGQENAKFACLIAALGMHNILFEGSAGSGKSMCAKRLVYIMPPQSLNEVLQANAYQSLNSKDSEFSSIRAFRNPHHTSTRASIFGGGTKGAKIGEVALANGGVLFFDEFPHFGKVIIESLREPLEDNQILVSRVNSKVSYETKFLFVAAQNPCPCGNLFSPTLSCRCSELEIKRYKNTISAAILDRIDLYVAMEKSSADDKGSFSSRELSERVLAGFVFQKKRGQKEFNAKLKDENLAQICVMDKDAQSTLNLAVARYNLSQRAVNKTLKVARTCADLEQREIIGKADILKALSFRVKSNQ